MLKGNLTAERQEALAEYWGTPEKDRAEKWGDPNALGKLLGISAATVRKAKADKRVRAMVSEALEQQLVYDVVEARAVIMKIVRNEEEKGDTRLKAARTMEQMAGNLSTGGPTVNVTNDFSTYEGMSDQELRELGRREFGIE